MGERMSTIEDPTPEDGDELELSPSEARALNSANRISGGRTQKALASIVLGFELIVVVLIGLTIYGLGILEPRELGLYIAGVLALACVLGLAFMRKGRAGIIIGWILHGLMLATAFLLPPALIVGGLFTALWIYCMVKGSRIDAAREAWLAANE